MQSFPQYLAAALIKGTRKHLSALHADFLEQQMSLQDAMDNMQNGLAKDTTTNNVTVGSQVSVGPIKPSDSKTLEGSYPGDHRPQAADATLPNNPPVRGETG